MSIIKKLMVVGLFLSLLGKPLFSSENSSRFSQLRSWVGQAKKPVKYAAIGGLTALAAYGGYRGIRSVLNLPLKNSIVGGAVAAYATYRASQFFFKLTSHAVMKSLYNSACKLNFAGSIFDLAKQGTAALPAHGIFSGPAACLASIREFVNKLEGASEEDSLPEGEVEQEIQEKVDIVLPSENVSLPGKAEQGDSKTVDEWLEELKKSKDLADKFDKGDAFENVWKEFQKTHGEKRVSKKVVEEWLKEYLKQKDEQTEDESLIEEPIVELGEEPVFESARSEQSTKIQPNVITESPSNVQDTHQEIYEYEKSQPQEKPLSKEEEKRMEKIWGEIERLRDITKQWMVEFKKFNALQDEKIKLIDQELNLLEAGWGQGQKQSSDYLEQTLAKIKQVFSNFIADKNQSRTQERLNRVLRHIAPYEDIKTQKFGDKELPVEIKPNL